MNKLRIIFIHGIAPTVISWDFSERLSKLIMKKLVQYNVVPEGASAEEIDEIITFERINYSKVGDEAQERLLKAYEQEVEKLYKFTYRLSQIAGLDKVRRQIITSVSDVLVYKSNYWRKEIQQMVLDKIDPYIATGDSVSIVAHSLGSVVGFDTLHHNLEYNPKWKDANYRPANLFTMGSPIALFTLDLEREPANPNAPDGTEITHANLVQDEGVWYNFLDAQDLIAYPLEILFADRFTLEDIVVQTGTNPRKAHDGYWENDEVADWIAGRLKLDYQRINTSSENLTSNPTPAPSDPIEVVEEDSILERILGL